MSLNLDPIAIAMQQSQRTGGASSSFFSIAENETKFLRFLTSLQPTKVVSHSCGANLIDIEVKKWDEAISAGQPMLCPQCGQPLSESDIVAERPGVEGVYMHRFVQTSDPQKKANFTCLGNNENALFGYVPSNGGVPTYQCPICAHPSNLNDKGQPKKPSYRLLGIAIEREIEQEVQNINGIPTPVMKGAKDVIIKGEDGVEHPSIVIVDMSWSIFWQQIATRFQDGQSITYYDWRITRTGSSLSTSYTCDPINIESPSPTDIRQYLQYMPDIKERLQYTGKPEYYVENGWQVAGFIPQADTAPAQAVANIQQAAAPVQPVQAVPVQPQPAPGGAIPWDVAQAQINQ